MDFIVSVKNDTDYAATLTAVTVNGAQWLYTQELTAGQSIANHARVVGMLDTGLPFDGTIVVHYADVAPGPDGADVTIRFSGQDLDGLPLIGYGLDADAFPNADVHLVDDKGSKFLLVTIAN
ncbi:hypothetical protein [Sanguibacter antarcticus]|uniref:Uncharacterized protein n=1 Tax=Sanguibacter antarcticus TaxID=372484 RepID=A0A2A9E7M3_9MICO|nr:hypothetical protein [Sanguibacter antarcticus]PFG34843.1 hypothetical protein ATL42_2771 [Sanguibacter antarcticus]